MRKKTTHQNRRDSWTEEALAERRRPRMGLAAPSFFRLPTLPARSWVEVGLFTASAICALLLAVLEMKQCLRGHRRREREMYVEIPASLATADVEKVPIQIPREGRTQDNQAAQYGAAGP